MNAGGVREALEAYKTATDRGEIIGYAAMARLASRTSEDEKAEILWTRFFEELASTSADTHDLGLDEPAMSIESTHQRVRFLQLRIERLWPFAVILLCGPAVGYVVAHALLSLRRL